MREPLFETPIKVEAKSKNGGSLVANLKRYHRALFSRFIDTALLQVLTIMEQKEAIAKMPVFGIKVPKSFPKSKALPSTKFPFASSLFKHSYSLYDNSMLSFPSFPSTTSYSSSPSLPSSSSYLPLPSSSPSQLPLPLPLPQTTSSNDYHSEK